MCFALLSDTLDMFYTYVLLCEVKNKTNFYIGYCEDLKKRFNDHLEHKVDTTKKFDKIKLVYYEACLDKTDARKREIQLKTGFGRGYLKRRLQSFLNSRV